MDDNEIRRLWLYHSEKLKEYKLTDKELMIIKYVSDYGGITTDDVRKRLGLISPAGHYAICGGLIKKGYLQLNKINKPGWTRSLNEYTLAEGFQPRK